MPILITRAMLIMAFAIMFCPYATAQPLSSFLDAKGALASREYLTDNISYFLDPRFRRDEIFWYDGTMTTAEGVCHEGLKLKFNTIENTLYLKQKGQYYRLSTYSLRSFTLEDEGRQRHFIKGFGEKHEYVLSAIFRGNPSEVLKYLADFEQRDSFQLTAFDTSWKPSDGGSLALRLQSSSIHPVHNLKGYLEDNPNFNKVKLESETTEADEQGFFEVLAKGRRGKLLIQHSKKLARSGGLSLVKNHKVITFDERTYFLANQQKEIRQVFFTKRSVKKALQALGIAPPRRICSVRNEGRLAECLRKIL